MKIIKKILIIPLILLLFGCNNSFTTKDNKTTTENTTTIEETTKTNIVIENGDVHYTY